LRSLDGFAEELEILEKRQATVSKLETWTFVKGLDFQSTLDFEFTNEILKKNGIEYESGEPLSYIQYPVFDKIGREGKTAGVLSATVYWKSYLLGETETQ